MASAGKGLELTDPQAYRARTLDLLGSRDPLEVIAETPDVLSGIVSRHAPEALRSRPFEGKWTPNEVIGHLMDTEWTYGFRVRMILCQDRPALLGMDQELWVTGQRHNERAPADLVAGFTALRKLNLDLWRRMSPADLDRVGVHNERGPESLGTILKMCAGHDLSHIGQINRYIEAMGTPRT